LLQKVHGPSPSLTQTIFPQLVQFGAIVRSGCLVAMQLHRRRSMSSDDPEVKVGFVCISRLLIAESRSERAVLAPCIGVPPAIEILVFAAEGAGEDVLEDLALFGAGMRSEISGPAADGGGFDEEVTVGACMASGFSCSASAFARGGSCALRCLDDPAI